MLKEKQFIYCDNAATTQTRQEVTKLLAEIDNESFGNSSSLHHYGQKAKNLLETSRETIAKFINAEPSEIYFTRSGTEANNLAILGLTDKVKSLNSNQKHIITSSIEHSSVDLPMKKLEAEGWQITRLNVDEEGFIDFEQLEREVSEHTLLVSIIHGNNEIGTIQDIKRIADLCKKHNVLFHSDTVQSIGKVPVDVKEQGVDFLSISGHKVYAPKGVGVLYIKKGVSISPLFWGGGQEGNLIPGTENIPGIAGLAKAIDLRTEEMFSEAQRLKEIQQIFFDELIGISGIQLNGSRDLEKRIPGNINLSFDEIKGDVAILRLNLMGVCASSGSACSSGSIEPSKVISALYPNRLPEECNWAANSIRLSFGLFNTREEALFVLDSIKKLSLQFSSLKR
ncbi:MAG: cysteine desulfurase family protein [Candidatus Caenarcaniphilales bacterium]|nr:cysteine desulfurase family protein [Candidatus Caenarcaniphilales bacterium]